jgi:cytochrome P450
LGGGLGVGLVGTLLRGEDGLVGTLLRGEDGRVRKGVWNLQEVRGQVERLAMHVLSAAAFGERRDWEGKEMDVKAKGHGMSFMECMEIMHPNLMGVVLFGGLSLPGMQWWAPKGLVRIKAAVEEFKRYMWEAVKNQQEKGKSEQEKIPNLASLLVRANDIEKDENLASGKMTGHLSDEELYGNMFGFNIAGYETTAMAMGFSLPHLALEPEVQEWARQEVDQVLTSGKGLPYEETFEKLVRVRAVMVSHIPTHICHH